MEERVTHSEISDVSGTRACRHYLQYWVQGRADKTCPCLCWRGKFTMELENKCMQGTFDSRPIRVKQCICTHPNVLGEGWSLRTVHMGTVQRMTCFVRGIGQKLFCKSALIMKRWHLIRTLVHGKSHFLNTYSAFMGTWSPSPRVPQDYIFKFQRRHKSSPSTGQRVLLWKMHSEGSGVRTPLELSS